MIRIVAGLSAKCKFAQTTLKACFHSVTFMCPSPALVHWTHFASFLPHGQEHGLLWRRNVVEALGTFVFFVFVKNHLSVALGDQVLN